MKHVIIARMTLAELANEPVAFFVNLDEDCAYALKNRLEQLSKDSEPKDDDDEYDDEDDD